MAPPIYTPYDGSSRPFTIGLSSLDSARWIEPDDALGHYLDEKRRLLHDLGDAVFAAQAGSEDAQEECLGLLADYLCRQHPDIYRRNGDIIAVAGNTVDLAGPHIPPLLKAGSLVADDLVIMRRRQDGWHLVAGHVCFPSAWSLREKFGRPMQAIHHGVPGFGEGTRNAMLITRIFDNLQPAQPVERFNWSISPSNDLYRPPYLSRPSTATDFSLNGHFARIERQTLRKLPVCGDIVFTIRIYIDPIAAIETHPRVGELASNFADQLEALDESQAAYKNLTHRRRELIRQLRALAAAAAPV